MARIKRHAESHVVSRAGWLRAAVLGANDGLLSTSSLILGVAAAAAPRGSILLTGVAGLVAGAMSMAAGEYVSVSSQADSEAADLAREKLELEDHPDSEHRELSAIYVERGLAPDLATKVAEQLMTHDALASHARDELGISEANSARPVQAAMASAASFAVGAALPLAVALFAPRSTLSVAVAAASLLFLGVLGATGARAGGAKILRPTLRVMFWGALAMATTAGIGALFGTNTAG
jgi:VIT1/CCC1 family predicted Fe2+/Mn2+ transporter